MKTDKYNTLQNTIKANISFLLNPTAVIMDDIIRHVNA